VTGRIGITLFSASMTRITSSQAGSLVNIAFHVTPGAIRRGKSPPLATWRGLTPPVALVEMVTLGGRWFVTDVDDNQGPLILQIELY
jgi:hypothetical protein